MIDKVAELLSQGFSIEQIRDSLQIPRSEVEALFARICHGLGEQAQ